VEGGVIQCREESAHLDNRHRLWIQSVCKKARRWSYWNVCLSGGQGVPMVRKSGSESEEATYQ
jgi:hypothetical protein